MQNHLQVVAKLFEDAGNGTDEEIWTQRFSEFTEKSLAEHATRLKSCETEEKKKAEVFRARSSLFSIVQDRVEAQIALIEVADRGPFDSLKALQTAQGSLVEEMISVVAEPPAPAQSPAPAEATPKAAESGGGGGGLAAALAASRGAESAPPGEFPPLQIDNDDGEYPSSPDVPTFGDEIMNTVNPYEGQMSPSSPKDANSPSSPNRTEVIREIRYCNSYSQRHLKTKSIAPDTVDGTFCARPPKEGVPLEQLHGVMHALYESKEQQDLLCKEASEPLQTMEQHFYSYLAKRYGRKFAVQEWAHAIFAAVQKYSQKDNGVSVFGKILQNKLAESFPGVLSTLRATVIQAMRAQLEASQPHMSPAEMQSLWDEFGGDGNNVERKSLALLECTQIVSALYNENDSEEIVSRLQQKAHNQRGAEHNCVQLRELLQVLYVFQTNLTEAFLEDFSKIFNAVDAEPAEGKPCANGVLTHPQLIELVHRLSTVEHVTGALAQDPYSSARLALVEAKKKMHFHFRDLPCATFSQCVDLCGGLINARWSATAAQADSENGA